MTDAPSGTPAQRGNQAASAALHYLLVALLAEIGLTRWIATQRRMHSVETVAFGPAIVDVQTFRERAKALVSVSNRPSGSASKA